jgi:hypothetical protein
LTVRLALLGICLALVVMVVISGPAPEDRAGLARQVDVLAAGPASYGLFVHERDDVWHQPLAVYPAAFLLRLGVSRDVAVVAPALVAALAVLWLTYLFAVRVPLPPVYALLAAALLLVTPGFTRYACELGADLLMVAAVLAWCVAVLEYLRTPRSWLPLAGGAMLAMAVYMQPAGVLAVPVFLALGAVLFRRRSHGWRPILLAGGGAGIVLMPATIWLLLQPSAYPDTFGRWAIHAAHIRNPLEGVLAATRWHVVARRVSDYWEYFNPTFLFGSGDLFATWTVLLVPLGMWATAGGPGTAGRWLLWAGFVVAPLSAVLLDVARAERFVLTLLPFGVVFAAAAVDALANRLTRFGK